LQQISELWLINLSLTERECGPSDNRRLLAKAQTLSGFTSLRDAYEISGKLWK